MDDRLHKEQERWQRWSETPAIQQRIKELREAMENRRTDAREQLSRVFSLAGEAWHEAAIPPINLSTAGSDEEKIRMLANRWGEEDWLVARNLGEHMIIEAIEPSSIWEVTVQTRWETRALEVVGEPYQGQKISLSEAVQPVWDYDLPEVQGLKPAPVHHRLKGYSEIQSCLTCNGQGKTACEACAGKGWTVCPVCKGRTKLRCTRCNGRSYIPDWAAKGGDQLPFQQELNNLRTQLEERTATVVDLLRHNPIMPLPIDPKSIPFGNPRVNSIPCPECVDGEVPCSCRSGKRICPVCASTKFQTCPQCGGTGKVIKGKEIVRTFELEPLIRFFPSALIPESRLKKATGEVVISIEIGTELPTSERMGKIPGEVWESAQEAITTTRNQETLTRRVSLQTLEITRIPVNRVSYSYADEGYTMLIYDVSGQEKFYAEGYPTRWKRVERWLEKLADTVDEAISPPDRDSAAYQAPLPLFPNPPAPAADALEESPKASNSPPDSPPPPPKRNTQPLNNDEQNPE